MGDDQVIAIIGGSPAQDDTAGLFTGCAGRELRAGLQRFCGIDLDECRTFSVLKRALLKGRDPKPAEIAEATPAFLDELLSLPDDTIVVTAGGLSTRMLLGGGALQLSNVHGIPHEVEVCGRSFTVFPIYGPGAGLVNKGFLAAFGFDLGRLNALLGGELQAWAPSQRPLRTSWLLPEILPLLDHFPTGAVVGVDTEGWKEKPWGLSFSPNGELGYVIPSIVRVDGVDLFSWFDRWIADKTVVMHNGMHDVPVLAAMGVHIDIFHDTQVLAYHDMIRTGSGVLEAESQNLGTLAYRESNLILGELSDCPGVDLASQVIPYSDDVMNYAGMDPIACHRLFHVYEARGLTEYRPYVIDMGQIGLVETMIANGLPFDADAGVDYYADVIDKLAVAKTELQAMAARFGVRDFNPGSPDQVRKLVTQKIGLKIRKRTRGGKASTNEKALADHKEHPFVKKLQDYRELIKLKGTYIEPLLDELLG